MRHSRAAVSITLVAALIIGCHADIYMHNPRGSNDRNRERNENRNNGNRLFDSQNNDKGGYAWAPPMEYYAGSILPIEWTNQHGCGPNGNTHCEVIIQYACNADFKCGDGGQATACNANNLLRDGTYSPSPDLGGAPGNGDTAASIPSNQNKDLTNTIPDDVNFAENKFFGRHETYEYYQYCKRRSRNKGLYIADRVLTGQGSTATRQNPNGARNGYECPEERDYYPYWMPTPWRDIAVIVSNTSRCAWYQKESQNVKDRYYCWISGTATDTPISMSECLSRNGQWRRIPAWNIPAPECIAAEYTRDNHLGNSAGPGMAAHYNWTIPQTFSDQCVLRIRYNVSNENYDTWGTSTNPDPTPVFDNAAGQRSLTCSSTGQDPSLVDGGGESEGGTAAQRASPCAAGNFGAGGQARGPLYNRPYVDIGLGATRPKLALAINTNQVGRTFQDRSYVFKIKARPADVPDDAKIYNLNVRGKRGNIVQTYPAVEYDFVPNNLVVTAGDYVHFQWVGSDFNPPRNPNNGEGQQNSDRHNIVQVNSRNVNFPMPVEKVTMLPQEVVEKFALVEQQNILAKRVPDVCINLGPNSANPINDANFQAACTALQTAIAAGTTASMGCDLSFDANGKAQEDSHPRNCGKLNGADARFNAGLVKMSSVGTYSYASTRNNNFSNRSQKGSLTVLPLETGLSPYQIVLITLGSVLAVSAIYGGFAYYAYTRPDSGIGKALNGFHRSLRDCSCCRRASPVDARSNPTIHLASAPKL